MIIPVKTNKESYDILLGQDILNSVSKLINLDRKVLIVTDSIVPQIYAKTIEKQCKHPYLFTIPAGEQSKSFSQFQNILSFMIKSDFSRNDAVIAVGGGVVGDLSGFVASTYMRGIDFYNIPTTLLSQIDSSIGGKTAIDFEDIKNIIGSFYQPKMVLIDINTLKTLDKRQLSAGFAEAVKMAATLDKDLFEFIENSSNFENDLPHIVEGALKIKKKIVEKDTKEKGLRKVLNFGHTIGHAVESSQDGKLLHGECVALGMIPFSKGDAKKRIISLLNKYELPTKITNKEELLPYLIHDKKKTASTITTVFTDEIGTFSFKELTPTEILELLED